MPRLVHALIKAPELCVCKSAAELFGREEQAIPRFQQHEKLLKDFGVPSASRSVGWGGQDDGLRTVQ